MSTRSERTVRMGNRTDERREQRLGRRSFLAGVGAAATAALAGCSVLSASPPTYDRTQAQFDPPKLSYEDTYPPGDVSMFRRGLRRLGYYPDATVPDDPVEKWSHPINAVGHTAAKSSPRPTPDGDRIVVASDTGRVHGFGLDGEQLWTARTGATNLGIHGTPTIVDGTAYVGGYDGSLYGVDVDTGERVWRLSRSALDLSIAIGSSPAYWDGVLYFVTEHKHPASGRLWAVDVDAGEPVWTDEQDIGGMPHPSPAIDPATERLVTGSNDGIVYAWEFPSLSFAWSFETDGEVKGTPPIYEGKAYVGSWDSSIYCLDLTDGTELWSFETDGIVMSNPGIDPERGLVYVGSGDGYVYALEAATGEQRWATYVGGSVIGSLTVTPTTVLVGSYDTRLYALESTTGRVRWSVPNRGHVTSAAVPHGDRIYYAERADFRHYWDDDRETELLEKGQVYCLGSDE
ncbi:outer membrane protein assembly factor BamB family protein [Halapricum hydrolyticum]|uniref:PQQ-binding-like beta-propeller repeat protein n=1 Tax=Halapricum hydrolyticum TaxID=2979991 RepID=A0AAE3IGL8_9EURY|nr:PQQ-binding-like beta-propeller repeat protein [Halapricum hydrolyticum]MCU4719208.1 PQQ-binding-like beta-propeller repeat protein [Halapricum hydrolyticum]MCU4728299.1 PQQ-binding-like beta-propeller repeat protein [Halapricum hydrolyticum]